MRTRLPLELGPARARNPVPFFVGALVGMAVAGVVVFLATTPPPPVVPASGRLERQVTITVKGADLDRNGTRLVCEEVRR